MIAEVDAEARLNSMRRGLPPCLHVPIAARDLTALSRFVGTPTLVSSYRGIESAFLVEAHDSPDERDATLPIWELERSAILHERLQLWVDVAYRGYRRAYRKAFPDRAVSGWHLDHVMNRQIARLKGLKYIRIVAISPGANTSSGGLSERMGIDYHSTPEMVLYNREHPTVIQHADLGDLVKMLNIKTGGAFQDPVNEAQRLVGGQVLPPRKRVAGP